MFNTFALYTKGSWFENKTQTTESVIFWGPKSVKNQSTQVQIEVQPLVNKGGAKSSSTFLTLPATSHMWDCGILYWYKTFFWHIFFLHETLAAIFFLSLLCSVYMTLAPFYSPCLLLLCSALLLLPGCVTCRNICCETSPRLRCSMRNQASQSADWTRCLQLTGGWCHGFSVYVRENVSLREPYVTHSVCVCVRGVAGWKAL